MGRSVMGACALLCIIFGSGCIGDIACINTPARIPPYQAAILAQPEWSAYFGHDTLAYAQQAKQVAVFRGDFSNPKYIGQYNPWCPDQYYVDSAEIHGPDRKDNVDACAVSAHELTHLMLDKETGDSDAAHSTPVWKKVMAVVSGRICGVFII